MVPLTTPWGLPCCVRFPCVHAVATTPAQRLGASSAHFPSRISLPRYGSRVGLHIVLFEACSAFTCVTACTLALPPYFVARLTEGFNRFVTSTVAPVASGWSRRRVGLAPTGKAPPFHGAHPKQTKAQHTLLVIRTVRNNIAHGGKIQPEGEKEKGRNERLVAFSLTVIKHAAELNEKVRNKFHA